MKIIKKIVKWIGLVCAALIILMLICVAIGTIVDVSNGPKFQKIAKQALDDLNASTRTGEDNAWNDYKIALDKLGEYRLSDELNDYVRGNIKITPEIKQALKDHADIINTAKKGTDKPYCSIPVKYEGGMTAEIPSLTGLLAISKLFTAQALLNIESGRVEDGINYFHHAFIYARHIINGNPLLINYMIGIALNKITINALSRQMAAGRFNKQQLAQVEKLLGEQENGLPLFKDAVESEANGMAISLADVRNPITAMSEKSNFLTDILVRLFCWREFFSPRLTVLKAIEFHRRIRDSIGKQEKAFSAYTEEERDLTGVLSQADRRDAILKNLFIKLSAPNYEAMLNRKFELIAVIRMNRLGTAIQSYYLTSRRFPQSLKLFDPVITFDPYVGKAWRLSKEGDSLILHSPGKDSGLPDDDIMLVLYK
ncbi:hypothetical protein A2Y85_05405 [candidate division WOR-3 bacterium RBG_13_43_14]|uniref:Uncharacterized protein n=1 Tax=candidate division WOR-3 bacterium RBG_13_43_14 TaxID=1802590 RepID=A0A1F4UBL6_UNCW3|nr:MAG: hypothetical protein A2Y85_05405 [candidate division WOR-3 bacterium RBG_13_43_14]